MSGATPVTVLEHDPDSGCVECPLVRRWPGAVPGETVYDCDAEWLVRKAEARRLGHAHLGPRRVSRYPAPSWCPLRSGPVEVRRG